jgi:hypothetical protein
MKEKDFYTLEDIIKMDTRLAVQKAIKTFGIEGTEQKIKELYVLMPKLRDLMLEQYYQILKGE